MRTVPLIRTPGELSPAWLSQVVGLTVGSMSWAAIGTGQMGQTVRIRYGNDESLVVKLASVDPTSRATAVRIGAYRREVEFYRAFGTGGGVPHCFGTALDEGGEWFTLVLEDLPYARTGDQFEGCTPAEVSAALGALAGLQAPTVGAPAPAWLAPGGSVQAIYQAVLPAFLARFGSRLEPAHVRLCEWFGPRVDAWAAVRPGPLGLVHGDLRADNLLFTGDRCTIVDWQTTAWGPLLRDVSYLLGGSLAAPDRAGHERDLLRGYAAALARPAVGWDELWEAYRHQSLYGVLMSVVASMIVQATARGDDMFATMLSRHAAHALDLDAPGLVPAASAALVPARTDEERHEAGPQPLWNESYYLDFAGPGGGGYVRLGRLPNQGCTHAAVAVVRPGGPSIMLVDAVAPLPVERAGGQRVAAGGFEVDLSWPAPLEAFRVRASGTGTAHADAAAHLRGEPGTPVPVELDLTWHTDGAPYQWRLTTRYEIPCRVTGHLTVGGERMPVDCAGQRDHSWGERDWWQFDWCWSALHLEDGTRWHSVALPSMPGGGVGYHQRGGSVVELSAVTATTDLADDGLFGPTTIRAEPGGHELRATPVGFGPLLLAAGDGRRSHFPRALCEVRTPDGRTGTGWLEWNLVQPPA